MLFVAPHHVVMALADARHTHRLLARAARNCFEINVSIPSHDRQGVVVDSFVRTEQLLDQRSVKYVRSLADSEQKRKNRCGFDAETEAT